MEKVNKQNIFMSKQMLLNAKTTNDQEYIYRTRSQR